MDFWIVNYIACLVISVLFAGLIIPKIMLIAFRRKLFDGQDERKIHHGTVPRLGGMSFVPSTLFSLCLVCGINLKLENIVSGFSLVSDMIPVLFLICSLMLLYIVGICDDFIGVRYRAKFVFQFFAGILVIISGVWMHSFFGFLGIEKIIPWIGWIFSILLIIYVINAMNLIDGIDGLASGLSIIALLFYSYVLFLMNEYVYALLAASLLGALLPFFYYNVFGDVTKHKKIFMGDTGSLTIGLVLAFIALVIMNDEPTNIRGGENLLVLSIVPILLPCLDVARVFIHRIKNGRNPFLPDKCHIHHKLLALGFGQRKAMVSILISDALLIALNLALSPMISATVLIIGDVLGWTFMNMLLTYLIRKREIKIDKKLYE